MLVFTWLSERISRVVLSTKFKNKNTPLETSSEASIEKPVRAWKDTIKAELVLHSKNHKCQRGRVSLRMTVAAGTESSKTYNLPETAARSVNQSVSGTTQKELSNGKWLCPFVARSVNQSSSGATQKSERKENGLGTSQVPLHQVLRPKQEILLQTNN